MDKFVIRGGKPLIGKVKVSGAKNSSLAIIPAAILNDGMNVFENIPEVNDIFTMKKLLANMGAETEYDKETQVFKVNTASLNSVTAPYEHVKKMRASVYVLGPLLARYGEARVSMPGGCAWGPRPINLHLEAMKKLGADIELEDGYIIAKTSRLQGAKINFDISSVGATGNALMAAVLAKGTTKITNAAIEPEITALARYLEKMGAKINGVGTQTLEIEGVDELKSANVANIGDRIEAGTLLIAAALTHGKIELDYGESDNIEAVLRKLEDSGLDISNGGSKISLDATNSEIISTDITTSIFPGFPTDMQAQWTAYMALANGTATIIDNIYFDRFKHIPELIRLGANIENIKNTAVVKGVKQLKGAKVMSTDLRASASLVLGGLAAEGTTEVLRIYHLDRGYQRIEEKLAALGADIERVKTEEF